MYKKRIDVISVGLILIVLNVSYIFVQRNFRRYSVYNPTQFTSISKETKKIQKIISPNPCDTIWSIFVPAFAIERYFPHEKYLSFEQKKMLTLYFGDEYKKLKPENTKNMMEKLISSGEVKKTFEDNLYNQYLKNIKKGEKFIVIKPQIMDNLEWYNSQNAKNATDYIQKINDDLIKTLDKYLTLKEKTTLKIYDDDFIMYVYIKN